MKLLFFDDWKLGVLKGDSVVDVSAVVTGIPHTGPHNLISGLIERFADHKARLEEAASRGQGVPVSRVKVRPPLPKPGNIVAMAVNYMEDGTRSEPAPINAFHKSPNAVIGDGDTMVLPDVPATIFEGEAEMAVIIGKRASNVRAADAMSYIFGYCNFIDGSARGLPPAGNTFYQMKSRDTFAPIGPYLVTADEIADPHRLDIRLWVNGELKQSFNTSDMAHKIPRCIEWVTSIHTLEPGDILATGTNHRGLSGFQNGDVVELETQGLGRLRFNVRDDLKRTWGRETRLDRQNKGLEGTTPQLSGKHTPQVAEKGPSAEVGASAAAPRTRDCQRTSLRAHSRPDPCKLRLACGLRAPPRIWTFLSDLQDCRLSGHGGAGMTGAAEIFAQPVTATSRGLPSKIGLSVVSISA